MKLAPVIVFNYNRPDHSKQVWDALAKNEYAAETELYLYCDGPKEVKGEGMNGLEDERLRKNRALVNEVQSLAKQYAIDAPKQSKFKAVHVICSENNKGLANSIIGGVTDVINKHGRVIVLEDDLLTSPYFLKFMSEALERYDSRKAVFTICANRPPLNRVQIPADYEYDVFVSQRPMSTGWATWADRWNIVDWSMNYLSDLLQKPYQIDAMSRAGKDVLKMLLLQRDHKIDSWAVQYCYAHFANHAVAIMPCQSYVDNIGFDGTGIHSGKNEKDHRNNITIAPENPRWLDVLYEDKRIINAFYKYCNIDKRSLWKRLIRKVYTIFGTEMPVCVEPKVYM